MVAHEVPELLQPFFMVHRVGLSSVDLSFQGFLYVFGGLLDSAYSKSRYPLWLFDIGELPRGAVRLVARRAAARLRPRSFQRQCSQRFLSLQRGKHSQNGNVYVMGLDVLPRLKQHRSASQLHLRLIM